MSKPKAIRNHYAEQGVQQYYEQQGAAYRNPHEPVVRILLERIVPHWQLDLTHVLDLAAGSGEATLALRNLGATSIDATDPYTYTAYETRTGSPCERYTFEDIAQGVFGDRSYSLIVCSFALHLIAVSWLPMVCMQLSEITTQFVILTPHKRPEIKQDWGWRLHETVMHERVRARYYQRIPK